MYALPKVPTITHEGRTFYQVAEAKRYYVSPCGAVYSAVTKRIIGLFDNGIGYLTVALRIRPGIKRRFLVHRLVAATFTPNPDGKPHVNHLDGNKRNNQVENLEWVTRCENMRHAVALGLIKSRKGIKLKKGYARGERHPNFKGWYVTPAGAFPSARAAAEAMGTYVNQIDRWCKGGKKRAEGYDFIPATSEGQQSALAA